VSRGGGEWRETGFEEIEARSASGGNGISPKRTSGPFHRNGSEAPSKRPQLGERGLGVDVPER
jgi:hypothetical protein